MGRNRANKYGGQKIDLGQFAGSGGVEAMFADDVTTAIAADPETNPTPDGAPTSVMKKGALTGFKDKSGAFNKFMREVYGAPSTADQLNAQLALDQLTTARQLEGQLAVGEQGNRFKLGQLGTENTFKLGQLALDNDYKVKLQQIISSDATTLQKLQAKDALTLETQKAKNELTKLHGLASPDDLENFRETAFNTSTAKSVQAEDTARLGSKLIGLQSGTLDTTEGKNAAGLGYKATLLKPYGDLTKDLRMNLQKNETSFDPGIPGTGILGGRGTGVSEEATGNPMNPVRLVPGRYDAAQTPSRGSLFVKPVTTAPAPAVSQQPPAQPSTAVTTARALAEQVMPMEDTGSGVVPVTRDILHNIGLAAGIPAGFLGQLGYSGIRGLGSLIYSPPQGSQAAEDYTQGDATMYEMFKRWRNPTFGRRPGATTASPSNK